MDFPFDRLTVVCISLMYYGLLIQGELHTITTHNVKLDPKKKLYEYSLRSELRAEHRGFSYTI